MIGEQASLLTLLRASVFGDTGFAVLEFGDWSALIDYWGIGIDMGSIPLAKKGGPN